MRFRLTCWMLLLMYFPRDINSSCRKRAVEEGRKCRKSCTDDSECTSKGGLKKCRCDGACGMTCFNPDAPCLSEPAVIPNGSRTWNKLTMGGKATYRCNTGFILKGDFKTVCCADKEWHGPPPTCEAGCLLPSNMGNSFPNVLEETAEVGEVIPFMCNTGYHMTGEGDRTCQVNGQMSRAEYSCSIQVCDTPPTVSNGHISMETSFTFGSTVKLVCNTGYEPESEVTTLQCRAGAFNSASGKWSPADHFPECTAVKCGYPRDPKNGRVLHRDGNWEYGNRITYNCNTGYKLIGSDIASCGADATWGDLPFCEIDPNCGFEEFSEPTCGYSNPYPRWERIYTSSQYDGIPGYIIRATTSGTELISAEIPDDWSSGKMCLQFRYKLLGKSSLLTISSTSTPFTAFWRNHINEARNTWLDSLVNIDSSTSIQYKFEANQPTVELDDVQVKKSGCFEHCKSDTCQNGGSCVNRANDYTCFCTVDFEGKTCDKDLKCVEPVELIQNGRLLRNNTGTHNLYIPGTTVTYGCNAKFKIFGKNDIQTEETITCTNDSWGGDSFWRKMARDIRCIYKTCTNPPIGSRQKLIEEIKHSWKVGEVASIECKEGYEFVSRNPTTTLTCGNDEQWIGSVTECTDATCTEPTKEVPNGYRSYKSWRWFITPLSKATYTCDENYKALGYEEIKTTIKITCTWDWSLFKSMWIPSVNSIGCTDIVCPNPNVGPHQVLTSSRYKWKVGYVAEYECDMGYEFPPDNPITSITCRKDETWSGEASDCQENVKCTNPRKVVIKNGYLQARSSGPFFPGASATIFCKRNHKISGQRGIVRSRDSVCFERPEPQIGSEWSLHLVECEEILCGLPPVQNNHIKPEPTHWSVGYIHTYTCKPGYIFPLNVTGRTSECSSDGTWSDPPLDCIEDTRCKIPHGFDISNGVVETADIDTFYPNSTVRITCDTNYLIAGRDNITVYSDIVCTKRQGENIGSDWLPNISDIICEEILCDAPPVQNNHVEPEPTHWSVGYIHTYTCKPGYIFPLNVTGRTSECSSDGTWSDLPLDCIEDTRCKIPHEFNISNGVVEPTDIDTFYPQSTVRIRCDKNYIVAGTDNITVYTDIVCTKRLGKNIGSDWLPNILDIICEEIVCKNPPMNENHYNKTAKQSWKVGETYTYECKQGYVSAPHATTTNKCSENGSWTVTYPTDCVEDMSCGEPPLIKKNSERIIPVNTENRQFLPGEIAMYRCKDHFYLNNTKENVQNISCTKVDFGSKWKPELTRCRPIKCPRIEETEGLSFTYNDESRKFDTIATFSCEPNHVLEGHHTLQCLKTGKWSGPFPVCKYVEPKPPVNNTKECVDIQSECPGWGKAYCYRDFMIANCKRTCGLCLEVHPSTTGIDSPTTITTELSTTTVSIPTTTTPTTTTATTESSTSTSEPITESKQKMDLMIMLPASMQHSDSNINSMKNWLKNVSHGLSTQFDLQISVVQYFEVWYNRKWYSGNLEIMKVPYKTQEQFGLEVDQLELKYDSRYVHSSELSSSVIEKSRNIMWADRRQDSVKSMITVFERYSNLAAISQQTACARHLDINTFIVGIDAEKRDIQKMASGLLSNDGVFMESDLNLLGSTVDPLIKELEKLNINTPINTRNGCYYRNIPRFINYCKEINLHGTKYNTHEEIDILCTEISYSYIKCRSDGTWSSLKKRCSMPSTRSARSIGCSTPSTPDNGYIINDPGSYKAGTRVYIGCVNGFTLVGKSFMKCKSNGKWTRTNSVCKANRCFVDPYLFPQSLLEDGAYLHYREVSAGESVTLQCESTSVLRVYGSVQDEVEITCELGGTWYPDVIQQVHCDWGDSSECQNPGLLLPKHALFVDDLGNYPINTILYMECPEGFIHLGDDYITCKANGEWSIPNFSCIGQLDCEEPHPPENSEFDINLKHSYRVGETEIFHCLGDYVYDGNRRRIECLADGTWSNPDGHCIQEQYCTEPLIPELAYIVDDPEVYYPGIEISIKCVEDHIVIGCSRMTCARTGRWSSCMNQCQAIICQLDKYLLSEGIGVSGFTPEELYHNKYNIDDTVVLSCSGNREPFLIGATSYVRPEITCHPGAQWEPKASLFHCQTACYLPEQPSGVHWSSSEDISIFNEGEIVEFECEDGYIYGSDVYSIVCQNDGSWIAPNQLCIPHGCLAPDPPQNSYFPQALRPSYEEGDIIRFTCQQQYIYTGRFSILRCFSNRTWSNPDGICKDKLQSDICACPSLPEHAVVVNDPKDYPLNTIITITCEPGFLLAGDNKLKCEETGHWSHSSSTCQEMDECEKRPCHHNGVCLDGINDFSCSCPTGYSGKTCEIDIDDCSSNPCHNGYCSDGINNFICFCRHGFTGTLCQTDIDECSPNPCLNGGLCSDGVSDFFCFCPEGFDGARCQNNIDDCSSNPCQHGGQCTDSLNGFKCTCADGYEGDNCETDSDDCSPNPCQHGGRCIDEVNGFHCVCADGYEGDNCETDSDDCSPNPCQHGGRCVDAVNGFHCVCADGYEGDNCETNIDDCNPSPCINAKACVDGIFDFTCECQDGYAGKHCQTDIDDCSPNPCQHGGQCADAVNGFKCTCADGYEGDNCETDSDDCSPNPCQHEGRCVDAVNGFKCDCADGYEGNNCETDSDDCSPNPCQHGGRCVDEVNGFHCVCADGYEGDNCETNIDDCNPSPCVNAKSCIDGIFDFTCECQDGYTGKHCQTDIDDCIPNPCQNGGSCIDKVNNFSCECSQGYEGKSCETNIDDCSSNPCQNGGSCTDKVANFSCECSQGYEGKFCDTNIDDCSSNPCQNGGSCTDKVNNFSCECRQGYEGKSCKTNIDDCVDHDCQHGGKCQDELNGYVCVCTTGYIGLKCETNQITCLIEARGITEETFTVLCPPGCDQYTSRLWGTEIYSDDSYICAAGIHDGRISADQGGELYVVKKSGQESYDGSTRNHITSNNRGYVGTKAFSFTGFNICEDKCRYDIRCERRVDDFYCECYPGYSGKICDINIDDCNPNPCQNDGKCTDDVNDFSCQCEEGYQGKRCETKTDLCNPNPCRHVERCENRENDFYCVCIPGYTGKRCEIDINDCLPDPCQNGGHCIDEVNDFSCQCDGGFEGKRCEAEISCKTKTCLNDGFCKVSSGIEVCFCPSNYAGNNCEADVNECLSNPCVNNGICGNLPGSFLCECLPGFTGKLCEEQ
ncbi:complement receptor type 1-like isoform X4 [Styela clava]